MRCPTTYAGQLHLRLGSISPLLGCDSAVVNEGQGDVAFSGHRTYTPHRTHHLNTQLNEAGLTSSAHSQN